MYLKYHTSSNIIIDYSYLRFQGEKQFSDNEIILLMIWQNLHVIAWKVKRIR